VSATADHSGSPPAPRRGKNIAVDDYQAGKATSATSEKGIQGEKLFV
jgi:hypothetical protein